MSPVQLVTISCDMEVGDSGRDFQFLVTNVDQAPMLIGFLKEMGGSFDFVLEILTCFEIILEYDGEIGISFQKSLRTLKMA